MAYMNSDRYYPNPDEDFVLQGGRPFYVREKKGFLSNSMLTDTTQNLTQHEYNSKKYGDDSQVRDSLCSISNRLNRVSGDIRRTLLKEASNEYEASYTQQHLNEVLRKALNANPPSYSHLSHLDWYSKPIHLSTSVNIPMNEEDMLATRYFPVTLGEARSIELVGELKPGRTRMSGHDLRKFSRIKSGEPEPSLRRYMESNKYKSPIDDADFLTATAPHITDSWWKLRRATVAQFQSRHCPIGGYFSMLTPLLDMQRQNCREAEEMVKHGLYDCATLQKLRMEGNNHLFQPDIYETAGISFTSPYSEEISKLRMEKLRMEEQQYLELKRQAELEKIRGPKPKWYELKTPEFHREANKNNELLRNSDKWDELLQYRENLLNATNQLKTALDDYKVPVY